MSTAKNLLLFIAAREYGQVNLFTKSSCTRKEEVAIQDYLEEKACVSGKSSIQVECPLNSISKTTFSVVFSSDGCRMASLHGDHTIKVLEVKTGHVVQTLRGHPRSPWTAEFHKSHMDILASGCLGGEVRIWDLSSGDCDKWSSPDGCTITSLSLHPTAKILAIALRTSVYLWNWDLSTQPYLYGSSKRQSETVRWVKFDRTGDMFYTGITANAEYDSWHILRQAPTAFELQRQANEIRRDLARSSRARSQYQASVNTTVSLGEMLGNPLEISNDLLVHQPPSTNNSHVDVYHAATTFAQLHRIHTGDETTSNTNNQTPATTNSISTPSASTVATATSSNTSSVANFTTTGPSSSQPSWSSSRAVAAQATGVFGAALLAQAMNEESSKNAAESKPPPKITFFNRNSNRISSKGKRRARNGLSGSLIAKEILGTRAKQTLGTGANQSGNTESSHSSSSTSLRERPGGSGASGSPSSASTSLFGVNLMNSLGASSSTSQPSPAVDASKIAMSRPPIKRPFIRALNNISDEEYFRYRTSNQNPVSNSTRQDGASRSAFACIPSTNGPSTTNADTMGTFNIGTSSTAQSSSGSPSQSGQHSVIAETQTLNAGRRNGGGGEETEHTSTDNVEDDPQYRGIWNDIRVLVLRLDNSRSLRRNPNNMTAADTVSAVEAAIENTENLLRNKRLAQRLYNCCVWASQSTTQGSDLRTRLDNIMRRLARDVLPPATCIPSASLVNSAAALGYASLQDAMRTFNTDMPSMSGANPSNGVRTTSRSNGLTPGNTDMPRMSGANPSNGVRTTSRSNGLTPGARFSLGFTNLPMINPTMERSIREIDELYNFVTGRHPNDDLMNRNQRIQRWFLSDEPENLDSVDNIIVHGCKIHIDCGIDISQDGKLLAVFVQNPNLARVPGLYGRTGHDTLLRIISLQEDNIGDVLHQVTLGPNPVSISFSPLSKFVVIGLAGYRSPLDQASIMYDIYKIPDKIGEDVKCVATVRKTYRDDCPALVNCVKWLPASGQGLVIGTNKGHVLLSHTASLSERSRHRSAYHQNVNFQASLNLGQLYDNQS